MKGKTNAWVKVFGVVAVLLIVLLSFYIYTSNRVEMELRTQNAIHEKELNSLNKQLTTIEENLQKSDDKVVELESNLAEYEEAINEKEAAIETLEEQLNDFETESEIALATYILDEIEIEGTVSKDLTDKHINLFDGEITFDDDDYEAEEFVILKDLVVKSNEDNFEDNVYLQIPEEGFAYVFEVESSFDTSKIDDDETLKITLMGDPVEISDWTSDSITFTSGNEHLFTEGDEKEIEGHTVKVIIISYNYVYVNVDGKAEKIEEGDTEEINGIDIRVEEVLTDDDVNDLALLKIGIGIENTIETGDEFDEDDDDNVFKWEITDKSIKLFNAEEFKYLDEEDTEFNVLGEGENLCLPNEYVCIEFEGLEDEPEEEYTFDIASKGGKVYVRGKGNFVSGLEDYDRIYIDGTGIYDSDINPLGTVIELGDTGMELALGTAFIKIENANFEKEVQLAYDLLDVQANNGVNIKDNDDNYRTEYGIVIEKPEDSCEDQDFKIIVPEDKLTATIAVY